MHSKFPSWQIKIMINTCFSADKLSISFMRIFYHGYGKGSMAFKLQGKSNANDPTLHVNNYVKGYEDVE